VANPQDPIEGLSKCLENRGIVKGTMKDVSNPFFV